MEEAEKKWEEFDDRLNLKWIEEDEVNLPRESREAFKSSLRREIDELITVYTIAEEPDAVAAFKQVLMVIDKVTPSE